MSPPTEGPPHEAGATPEGRPAELFWRGRMVSPSQAAGVFLLGSLAILVVGVALNYFLTDGTWESPRQAVQSAFGESPTYLTASPYDVTSFLILLVALIALGTGFVAAYAPRLRSQWPLGSGSLAVAAFVLAVRGSRAHHSLFLVLSAVLGVATLVWVVAALIGPGRRMHQVRALGFVLFGFYWATQAMRLYAAEEGDLVNGAFAAFGVLFFNYFAYHEMLSLQRNEDPRALHWLAGAAFLTTGVYVATHKLQVVSEWLILRVSEQTTWLLQFFDQPVERGGGVPEGSMILYPNVDPAYVFPIQIILACTAIQSIMIFVGGLLALRPPRLGEGLSGRPNAFPQLRPTYQSRRFFALLLTIPLIYALNLLRNLVIIMLSANGNPPYFNAHAGATTLVCQFTTRPDCGPADAAFWFSHNVIGKGGSLVALVIIAFMVFQILPELYDSIIGLLDLKGRRGPLERWFGPIFGRRGNGGARAREPVPSPPVTPHADPAEARP
jgi:archaeosortase A